MLSTFLDFDSVLGASSVTQTMEDPRDAGRAGSHPPKTAEGGAASFRNCVEKKSRAKVGQPPDIRHFVVCPYFVDHLSDCDDDRVRRLRHVVVRIHDYLPSTC
jgi:hypothetical protein